MKINFSVFLCISSGLKYQEQFVMWSMAGWCRSIDRVCRANRQISVKWRHMGDSHQTAGCLPVAYGYTLYMERERGILSEMPCCSFQRAVIAICGDGFLSPRQDGVRCAVNINCLPATHPSPQTFLRPPIVLGSNDASQLKTSQRRPKWCVRSGCAHRFAAAPACHAAQGRNRFGSHQGSVAWACHQIACCGFSVVCHNYEMALPSLRPEIALTRLPTTAGTRKGHFFCASGSVDC